jgi:hypothetical protein
MFLMPRDSGVISTPVMRSLSLRIFSKRARSSTWKT